MTNTDQAPEASPFGELPAVYQHYMPDNSVSQISQPCYLLLADCFFDNTFWQEGEKIVTNECPNYQMQPLNKAAGQKIDKWLLSLPTHGIVINIDDQVEAAHMLRNHPDIKNMSHEDASAAYLKLALGLKKKRDASLGMALPPLAGGTWGTQRSNAPAMTHARFTDPSRRGPGQIGEQAVLHQPQRQAEKVARASGRPAMSGAPLPTR